MRPHAILSMLVISPLLSWAVNCTAQVPASDPNNTGNWKLNPAFSDEFDGSSLDTSKWATNGIGWNGRPPSYFSASNVKVSGGNLQLILSKPSGGQYAAAEVNSKGSAPYGYYEARIKAEKSSGSTAFWFAGEQGQYKIELDVVETTSILHGGTGPADQVFMSAHLWALLVCPPMDKITPAR